MSYYNSKRFGSAVQLYHKSNGDISYYITYKNENNKLRRVKRGEKSKGITEAFCNQRRIDILNKVRLGDETPLMNKKIKTFTLQNAYDEYIEYAKNNKKTWRGNDLLIYNKHIKKTLGERPLISLKPMDFEKLKQDKLKEGLKAATVVRILGTARHAINYAINNELIKNYANPIAKGRVKMPQIDNQRIGFLTKEQAYELLKILEEREEKLAYYLTILLLYTGARFSEVASLTWYDINFNEELIYFHTKKNGNPRTIKMASKVKEVLKELEEKRSSHLILPSTNGKQITQMPRQWQIIVNKMIPGNEKAERHKITIHSLRHTHASWLAISGMTILEIKEQLGHKKLDMTLRYSHLMPTLRHEKMLEVFEKF